jgi:enoyl-CoA hydratase/carnithine racemase
MLAELGECLEDLTGRGIHALTLTAEGDSFCSGGNLAAMAEMLQAGPEAVADTCRTASQVALALASFPAPTIAGVQGAAIGGGAALALACDYVIAEPGATIGLTFTRLGLPAGDMLIPWLVGRRVGTLRALHLLFDGAVLGAEDAGAIGLVDQVVPQGQLEGAVIGKRDQWSQGAAGARAQTKAAILRTEGIGSLRGEIDLEAAAMADAVASDEFRHQLAGLRARVSQTT